MLSLLGLDDTRVGKQQTQGMTEQQSDAGGSSIIEIGIDVNDTGGPDESDPLSVGKEEEESQPGYGDPDYTMTLLDPAELAAGSYDYTAKRNKNYLLILVC